MRVDSWRIRVVEVLVVIAVVVGTLLASPFVTVPIAPPAVHVNPIPTYWRYLVAVFITSICGAMLTAVGLRRNE